MTLNAILDERKRVKLNELVMYFKKTEKEHENKKKFHKWRMYKDKNIHWKGNKKEQLRGF